MKKAGLFVCCMKPNGPCVKIGRVLSRLACQTEIG